MSTKINVLQVIPKLGYGGAETGCYDITLEVSSSEGCVATSVDLDAICVFENPIAAFSVDNQVFSTLVSPVVQFNNESQYAIDYLWEFGDNQSSITQDPIHSYSNNSENYLVVLIASNELGCQDTASLVISVIQDISVYVPNTFTPNDDEYNQYFLPILTDGFKENTYHLTVFNRWGEVVFESYDQNYGWDGTYGAESPEKCQDGTYIWVISVEELRTGENKVYRGHVNLIR